MRDHDAEAREAFDLAQFSANERLGGEDKPSPAAPPSEAGREEVIEFAGKLHFFMKPWLLRDEYLAWYLTEAERLLRAAAARIEALEAA